LPTPERDAVRDDELELEALFREIGAEEDALRHKRQQSEADPELAAPLESILPTPEQAELAVGSNPQAGNIAKSSAPPGADPTATGPTEVDSSGTAFRAPGAPPLPNTGKLDRRPALAEGQDAREQEDWFQRLPELAKDDIRRQWGQEIANLQRSRQLRRNLYVEDAWHSGLIFGLIALASTVISPRPMPALIAAPLAAVIGAPVGWACGRISAGRHLTVIYSTLAWIAWIALSGLSAPFWHLYEILILYALTAMLGIMRESRRKDGYGT
jgi:hypothetical protein